MKEFNNRDTMLSSAALCVKAKRNTRIGEIFLLNGEKWINIRGGIEKVEMRA